MKPRAVALALVGLLLAPAAPVGASPVRVRYECFGRTARLTEPDRRGVIRGTARNDVIIALRGDLIVLAGAGRDRICTGGGDDFVSGASGRDLIHTGRGRDRADGGGGQDYLDGAGGHDRLQGGHGASDTLVGGSGDDDLRGGDDPSGGDYIFGGRGDDILDGGNGDSDSDFLVGGDGTDVVEAGSGRDTVSFAFSEVAVQVDLVAGTSSTDTLSGVENVEGSLFDDLITGADTGSRLFGDEGDDLLLGGISADHIDGGLGQDSMDGGGGLDLLSFLQSPQGVTADLETGSASGEATDVFTAFEHLQGSSYDDELSGDAGSNEIYGGRGDDALFGRDGDDRLHSGSSGDAGAGTDICWDSGGVIDGCEQELHGDPAAFSTLIFPTQAASLPVAQMKEVWGSASGGAFGPEPQRVQIALRRLSGTGCYWWNAKRAVMRPGHCERPLWVDTDFDTGQGTWSRRIPAPVQLLNAGRYQLRSRIRQRGYTELGYDLVEFRLR